MKGARVGVCLAWLLVCMACSPSGQEGIKSGLDGGEDVLDHRGGLLGDYASELGTAGQGSGEFSKQDDVEEGTASGDMAVDGIEPDVQPDVEGPQVTVSTYSPAGTVPAGIPLQFECIVQGLAKGTYATYLAIAGPADVEVDELAVIFHKAGNYSVGCRVKWAEGEAEDPTPLAISVVPGQAAYVDTLLSKDSVKAGDSVMVTCLFKDEYDNVVETPAKVAVDPQLGLDVYGMKIVAVKTGEYKVACVEPVEELSDPTPAILKVSWGMPKKLETTLAADTIVAGTQTQVSCKALDAFGNVVPDFPMAVFLSKGLTISGFSVGGTKAGTYQVICVPQTGPWDVVFLTPRLLTVVPGAPSGVSLEAVPSKPVYFTFETVQFIVTAVDDYGNIVEGVKLLPLSYEPPDPGIVEKGPLKYKFETEGVFLFSACLEEKPKVCGTRKITVDGFGPIITIKYPERGATIMGKPAVNIVGNVIDPVSGIASFTINGKKVPLDEYGNFVYPVTAKQGLNLIVAIAEDPNGFKTLLVQSYYYSPVWHKVDMNDPEGSKIQDGLLFFLADEFFDKLPHDYSKPDNLSTIAELALQTLDIGSFIPNPVATVGPYKVYIGPFSYPPPVIHIKPIDGGILAEVHIYDLKVHVEAEGECKVLFVDLCPDVSGNVEIDEVMMWEGLNIWAENGQVKTSKYQNFIGIYGLDVHIDGLLGFLFGWIVDWFAKGYVGILEQTAMKMVDEQVAKIADGLLNSLQLNQQLEIPNPLDPNAPPVELSLVSSIRELEFSHAGVEVRLDAAVLAPKKVNKNPLGSIGRASCLKWLPETFYIDKDQFAVMALYDDLLNEVLFAAWYGGLLDMKLPMDQFLDPAALEELGIDSLEELGIKDLEGSIQFFLPPIITSCTNDNHLEFQVGDVYVELNMKMLNEPVTIGMFVSLAAQADIEIVDGPDGQKIKLGIGEMDPVVAQVTYISNNLKGAEMFMSMIVQAILLPQLLSGFAESSLASFPLPVINVSSFSNMLPPNIIWLLVIDSFYRELGYTSLIAHVECQ